MLCSEVKKLAGRVTHDTGLHLCLLATWGRFLQTTAKARTRWEGNGEWCPSWDPQAFQ